MCHLNTVGSDEIVHAERGAEEMYADNNFESARIESNGIPERYREEVCSCCVIYYVFIDSYSCSSS